MLRHFVPRGEPAVSEPPHPALLAHVLDAFVLRGVELAVVCDRVGGLHVVEDPGNALPPDLRAELSRHELARGGLRKLEVEELWLLDLQLLEQPPDAPGHNDPVFLYGQLVGPFPAWKQAAESALGQLTVTRADLLAGLARSAQDRFGAVTHAWLPGDEPRALAEGRGMVLAFALCPPELRGGDVGNEAEWTQLAHDVLAALQADLPAEAPFRRRVLPVPDRPAYEAELEANGWVIQGEEAIRAELTKDKVTRFLTGLFGSPDHLRQALPPEGRLPDYLELAKVALTEIPGWPDERARSLERWLTGGRPTQGKSPPLTPRPPEPPPPDPTPRPRLEPRQKDDWMKDFEHGPAKERRVTKVRKPGEKARPTWMDDFE